MERWRSKGTRAVCDCEELRLVNCQMVDCDLACGRWQGQAEVTTPIDSVKNPLAGSLVTAPAVGEVIRDIDGATGVVEIAGEEDEQVRACA